MNNFKIAAALAALLASLGQAQAAVTDTVQSPTGFFVPSDALKSSSPYYRGKSGDWGWTHNAIGGTITTASLNISAYDVDFSQGERDEIFALDGATWVSLGFLAGANNAFAFSNFVLGANFFDDIATGLQVKMDIDTTGAGWFVSLAKSSLSTDGSPLPPPVPGIPEPETYALMLAGLGVVGAMARRRQRK